MRKRLLQTGVSFLAFAAAPGLAAASPKTVDVKIEHFAYTPATIEVAAGDTIVFTNNDIVPHTATAVDQSWNTGELAHGESARVTMPQNAGADYFCIFHPMMKGKLVLVPPG